MEKIADVVVKKSPDYDKQIDVRMTVGELMVIKAVLGETSTDDNVRAAAAQFDADFANKVREEDLGFKVFQAALKILYGEDI